MEITKENIDELLEFLPLFESEEFEPVIDSNPYPEYDPQVEKFFKIISRPPWIDKQYNPEKCQEIIKNNKTFDNFSLSEVRSLLTYCNRGERMGEGFWAAKIRDGHITALLKRLAELKEK